MKNSNSLNFGLVAMITLASSTVWAGPPLTLEVVPVETDAAGYAKGRDVPCAQTTERVVFCREGHAVGEEWTTDAEPISNRATSDLIISR